MGNKLMRKMVAAFVAAAMVLTSGIGVFAAGSPELGQVATVDSHGHYGPKTMDVSFTPVKDATKYVVTMKGQGGSVVTKETTVPAATLAGLVDGECYDITVVASTATKSGKASIAVAQTMSKRWIKNTKIKKVKRGKKKATLKWKKVKGATAYQIAYSKDKIHWQYKIVKGNKTKATIKKLSKGKWYFQVRPVKGDYLGILSTTKSCKVKK